MFDFGSIIGKLAGYAKRDGGKTSIF